MTTGDQLAPEQAPVAAESARSDSVTPDSAGPQNDAAVATPATKPTSEKPIGTGPLAGAVRGGPLAARGLGIGKPSSPTVSAEDLAKQMGVKQKQAGVKPKQGDGGPKSGKPQSPRPNSASSKPGGNDTGSSSGGVDKTPKPRTSARVAVPNRRMGLSDDLQAELDAELAAADVEAMLSGSAGMSDRKEPLSEGARVAGQILKVDADHAYVALGGPDEGMVPLEQFAEEPVVGAQIEVLVRAFAPADGLYLLGLPGAAIDVSAWEDIDEGSVVEAVITGHNAGGLECKVGNMKGFIPMGQIAEHRVEDASEFVDQRFLCVVTESNERRGNLVLSRRAITEREREEKRKEQLENIEPGQTMEGIVRSVKDFGAFVDLGGLDGLIHISKLSWDRVGHPSEVLQVGQKVQVQIDKVDKETGKIGLSYRDLQENPWDTAEAEFATGSVHTGTVTRIANFGCFVRLGAGVEGLVHISEVASHRVSRIDAFVSEGQEVEVKVLSFDRAAQKIGLSIKQANAAPVETDSKPEEIDEPQRDVAIQPTHVGPLKGGNNTDTGGDKFGLRW